MDSLSQCSGQFYGLLTDLFNRSYAVSLHFSGHGAEGGLVDLVDMSMIYSQNEKNICSVLFHDESIIFGRAASLKCNRLLTHPGCVRPAHL